MIIHLSIWRMKMTKWKVKNDEKKEYKVTFGETDYNIPTFGYKSSLFIVFVSTLIVIFVPLMFEIIFNGVKWPGLIVSSIMIGFVFSYAQFFIQSKKGFSKSFWIVGFVLSILVFIILFIAFYGNIIL